MSKIEVTTLSERTNYKSTVYRRFFALEVCYLFGGIDYPISGCKKYVYSSVQCKLALTIGPG